MLVWEVGTQEEAIIEERDRLKKDTYDRETLGKFGGFVPEWMPIWLGKSNETHLKEDACKKKCKNCGKQASRWIEAKFSFCDEYDCGIVFCEKCANELPKIFKEKLKSVL